MDEQVNNNGILTFDEILEDELYKAEFDKRVTQMLEINSHPGVKGGNTMDSVQKQENTGEKGLATAITDGQAPIQDKAVTPTAELTPPDKEKAVEPAREMTAEQFELYNDTLRRVSKTAKSGLPCRYNAFEDTEVKSLVKNHILAGEKPDVSIISAGVVTRLSVPEEENTDSKRKREVNEMLALKAELALMKAGITPERLEAAKKLFIAEGCNADNAPEFAARYPEWRNTGVSFSKAPPLAGRTAARPDNQPILNDFERKVAEARKKAGLN